MVADVGDELTHAGEVIPDMLVLIGPVELMRVPVLPGDELNDRIVLLRRAGQLGDVGVVAAAVGDQHIGFLHTQPVLRGGLIGMRVDCRAVDDRLNLGSVGDDVLDQRGIDIGGRQHQQAGLHPEPL